MTNLSRYTVLLVDLHDACPLRERLLGAGATVHVATSHGAPLWASTKKIDAAFIGFDAPTVGLLTQELAALGVRVIMTANQTQQLVRDVASALFPHPSREVQYVH